MDYIVSKAYDNHWRKLYTKYCINCSAEMLVPKHVDKQFCTVKCRHAYANKLKFIYKCTLCGQSFTRSNSKLKLSKTGFIFCSRSCKDKAQRVDSGIKIHPKHYNDGYAYYKKRAIRYYGNKCQECGISDMYNGKPIILDVHHIDGNRKNGAIENLKVVCPNCHRQEEMMKWGVGVNR